MSGTGMSVQGDSASFLFRTASLNTVLMTRWAAAIWDGLRPLRLIVAIISLISCRLIVRICRSPITGYT
jgi:hypothetical protein